MKSLVLILILLSSPTAVAELAAAYELLVVPPVMTINEEAVAVIGMRNVGPETWTGASLIRLGSQNPGDNLVWGSNRIPINREERITPGERKDFQFPIVAPGTPGIYSFQWKMVQGSSGWFGDATPNSPVIVLGPNWLKRVYGDILGREPSDKEKQVAMKLITGGFPFSMIPLGVLMSQDNAKVEIVAGYKKLLSREPKLMEAKAWKDEVINNGLRSIITTLAASDEYYKIQGGTNRGFITGLFRDLLYNPPDENLEAWIKHLEDEKFSRRQIVDEFLNSEWYCRNLVLGWYRKYLRQMNPDLQGDVSSWVAEVQKGTRWEEVLADLLSSDEYQMGSSRVHVKPPVRAIATEDSYW